LWASVTLGYGKIGLGGGDMNFASFRGNFFWGKVSMIGGGCVAFSFLDQFNRDHK